MISLSWLVFVTRVTPVEQDLLTLPEYLTLSPVCSGVRDNQVMVWFSFMVFNVTFNNISVISAMSWLSVLLVEETAVPGENHRTVAYHIMLYRVHEVMTYYLTSLGSKVDKLKDQFRQFPDELADLKKNGDLRQNDIDILKKQQESKIAI
jgi:hypothetical protein